MKRLSLALSAACLPLVATAAATGQPIRHAPGAPAIWVVQNCSDHDPGSLRDIVENAGNAAAGDIVDLSHLPTLCGLTDSVISLDSEITIVQDDLSLTGPSGRQNSVTISGGGLSRVINHTGVGTLDISDLKISQGYYQAISAANGGCILSSGSVALTHASVTGCKAKSSMGAASGGGIAAHYDVGLDHSVVSGNQALAPTSGGYGGGIRAASLHCKYSSISSNSVITGLPDSGAGGGAMIYGPIGVYHSTIDHNAANYGSALRGDSTRITNSTISHNTGKTAALGIESGLSLTAEIANSTIAFNEASDATRGGGVYFGSPDPLDTLSIHSSIIANNTAGPAHTPSDIYIKSGGGVLAGSQNLVMAANVAPGNVITVMSDPNLGPLQLNGGDLQTHALLPGSPAIGAGNRNVSFPPLETNTNDERGSGHPRATSIAGNDSVDLGAVQFETIFSDGFD